jgi:hypothetical protein
MQLMTRCVLHGVALIGLGFALTAYAATEEGEPQQRSEAPVDAVPRGAQDTASAEHAPERLLGQLLLNKEGIEIGRIISIAHNPRTEETVAVIESEEMLGIGAQYVIAPLGELRVDEHVVLSGPTQTAAGLAPFEPEYHETIAQAPGEDPPSPADVSPRDPTERSGPVWNPTDRPRHDWSD